MALRLDMSVSDGSPIDLRWVSDNNNMFVNSLIKRINFKTRAPCIFAVRGPGS